ncbi:hypothetical protein Halru_2794 [Halovivax ruber XH-70]|uniref:Uncharacterized protein n=1 Tax=Halovivax ruber (strain DSM 18193 / JCM 13892 / XH-70) TaxID=797302 RepID=L0ICU9_HALRX|nr:hypothetical protein Halru_2794 [Halovivax ruber XH-70]
MTGFVPASSLYNVETQTSIPHPAVDESTPDREKSEGSQGDSA